MERDVKIIMSTLAAAVLFAGFAAPANADYRIPSIVGSYANKYAAQPSGDVDRYVKTRRALPRDDDEEYIADSRETGSGSWWRQMDRESRGGRK